MSAVAPTTPDRYIPGQGLPLAVPIGSRTDTESTQATAAESASREPNISRVSRPSIDRRGAGGRIGKRALAALADRLSSRDKHILRLLDEHRFLTTHQVQAFCFVDHDSAASAGRTTRRVLARLQRDGLVKVLRRRVGGVRAGSAATIWHLASPGRRIVHEGDDRRQSTEPSDRFVRHHLAVADVHVLLSQHRRIEAIEDITVEVEPAAWRTYHGAGGEARQLKPDLYAEITTHEFVDRLFIEVDLGTESIPTLLSKCEQYEAYRRSGVEQHRHGSMPLVLWLFDDPARADTLRAAVHRTAMLTDAMYRFATPETLTQVVAGGSL